MKYDCNVEVFQPTRWHGPANLTDRVCATAQELKTFLLTHRTRHAVVVDSVQDGGTHRYLMDAVRTIGDNTRAVGTLSRYTDDIEIDALSRLGMRGARVVMQSPNFFRALEEIEHLHDVLPRDWHIELTGSCAWLAGLAPRLARLSRTFVAVCSDMWQCPFALQDTTRFLWWLEMGNVYLKLLRNNPLRCQSALCIAQPVLATALAGAADRLLWGSGWPYQLAGPLPITAMSGRAPCLSWPTKTLDCNARAVYGFDD